MNIKDNIYQDFSNYFNEIKAPFNIFIQNHKKKKVGKAIRLSLIDKPNTNTQGFNTNSFNRLNSAISDNNSTISELNTETRGKFESSLDKTTVLVGREFFNSAYKIEEKFLNLKLTEIHSSIGSLLEKSGICEKEVSKTLVHSNIIYHYILDHKYFFNYICEALDTICFTKVKFAKIKHRYIDNGVKHIALNKRKEKISSIMIHLSSMKLLKSTFEKLQNFQAVKINTNDINSNDAINDKTNKLSQLESIEEELELFRKEENCEITKLQLYEKAKQLILLLKSEIQKESLGEFLNIIKYETLIKFNYIYNFNENSKNNNSNLTSKVNCNGNSNNEEIKNNSEKIISSNIEKSTTIKEKAISNVIRAHLFYYYYIYIYINNRINL